jgi:transposase
MIPAPPGVRVLVWSAPVDFRAGMDRLAALVQVTLHLDPFAGDVFVFRSRRPDRLKLLVYDGSMSKPGRSGVVRGVGGG